MISIVVYLGSEWEFLARDPQGNVYKSHNMYKSIRLEHDSCRHVRLPCEMKEKTHNLLAMKRFLNHQHRVVVI